MAFAVSRAFKQLILLFLIDFIGGGGIRTLGLSLYYNDLVTYAVILLTKYKYDPGCLQVCSSHFDLQLLQQK